MNESAMSKRIAKWDLILNEIHADLKFLHGEFEAVYMAIQTMEAKNEYKKM